jgi:ATP-dependent RNA helicase RhlE
MRFEDMNLAPEVVQASALAGWDRPTALQERAIPALLTGRDLAVCQSSGAGKTAGYLLPLLHRLATQRRQGLRALILVPAGDHAVKVAGHCSTFGEALSLPVATLGEEGTTPPGVPIALATPATFRPDPSLLGDLDFLVLDGCEGWVQEAGEESLKAAALCLPGGCQRVLLSDALVPEVVALHALFLRSPAVFPSLEGAQSAYPVPPSLKVSLLLRLLTGGDVSPSLVLARSRHRADRLFRALGRKGVKVLRIQGRAGRGQRERWTSSLESGQKTFLVAAELDTPSYGSLAVPSMIYFDTPGSPGGYTGRFQGAFYGPAGKTIIFVGPEEEPRLEALEAFFGAPVPRKILDDFDYTAPAQPGADAEREEGEDAEAAPAQVPASRDRRTERDRGRSKQGRDRRRDQGRPVSPQPQPPVKPKLPQGLPKAGEDDEDGEDDAPQPNYNTDRPLFPGARPFRWNSYRLSLERVDGGAPPKAHDSQETPSSDGQNKARKNRKRKGRTSSNDRPAHREGHGRAANPSPLKDGDSQPDSNQGERRLASQEVVARRFNRSARYSSLAGAPIPPPEGKE